MSPKSAPVIVIGSLVLSFIICLPFDLGGSGGIVVCLLWVVLIVLSLVIEFILPSKRDNPFSVMEYTKETHTLTIKKRCSATVDYVFVGAEISGSLKHNPAQLVYTSASVGGVTVGNFDIQDESYSFNNIHKTGGYLLQYGDKSGNFGYCPIYTIQLTKEIAEEAKNNPFISKFLSKNKLSLKGTALLSKASSAGVETAMKQGNISLAANIIMASGSKSILAKDDCKMIIKWLAGKD